MGIGQPSDAFITPYKYDVTMQEQNVTKIVKNYHFEWLSTPITFIIFGVEPLVLLLKKVHAYEMILYEFGLL